MIRRARRWLRSDEGDVAIAFTLGTIIAFILMCIVLAVCPPPDAAYALVGGAIELACVALVAWRRGVL